MVKKTLLSLAIAATAAGLAGCNVSTTDKYDNDIDQTPVLSGQPGFTVDTVTPQFQPTRSPYFGGPLVPLATDIVFGINSQLKDGDPGKDGTADTVDTTPPVTTALTKLDGFSTTASLYTEFTGALDPDSVVAGKTVFLIKLKNAEEDAGIDALDLTTQPANPVSANQPVAGVDYEARYITLDDGRNHAIQVLPKKPLDPKTKYVLAFTTGIQTAGGQPITASGDTLLIRSNQAVPPELTPLRALVKAWDGIASAATGMSIDGLALTYAFTTGGGADVLKAMAAPGTFLTSQMPTYVHAEGAIKGSVEKQVRASPALVGADEATINGAINAELATSLAKIAQGVGQKLNAANAGNTEWTNLPLADGTALRTTMIASDALRPFYYAGLITTIAYGQGAGLDSIVDKPKSRTFATLVLAPNTPVAVSYDAFLTAQITPKVIAEITKNVSDYWKAVTPDISDEDLQDKIDNALASGTTLANAGGPGVDVTVPSQAAAVAAQRAALSSKGTIYQGGLQVPSYLPEVEADKADFEFGSWTASDAAAVALGRDQAPRDVNGSTNVTYRFPFAEKLGDNVIPVLATLPDTETCGPKPADGWPVAIYQHGITVDRTAGVLVGNALAKACVAMVAIDHAMHGVGPTSATGLVFNTEIVSKNYNPAVPQTAAASPFALARADAIRTDPDSFFADLKERHNNVGKNAQQQNVNMVFKDAAGAAADAVNVGSSGDLYINLQDFARTRDGMRQTVLDLMNLAASIDNMDINADGTSDDLDPAKVYFIGHSLGGIIGTTFLAVNNDPQVQMYSGKSATNPIGVPTIKGAVLGNAGGGVVKLLENSPAIGALKILPGLKAKAGLEQGSANLEKFFGVFQATVDSADPINFAGAAHMQTLPILSYTAVGDSVVPNHALGEIKYSVGVVNGALTVTGATQGAAKTAKSHLSGTAPLDRELGITKVVNGATPEAPFMEKRVTVRVAAQYTKEIGGENVIFKNDHGTFSSADPQATFAEIFGQIGSFLAEKTVVEGNVIDNPLKLTGIKVTDTSVLEQVAE